MGNRWKDIFNYKEKEVIFATILSFFLCWFSYFLDVYEEFNRYEAIFQSACLEITGGMIGLLGFSLSGVAIIVTLFSDKQVKLIEQYNKPNIVEDIMTSFVFLAFCASLNVFLLFCVNLALSSKKAIVRFDLFNIFLFCIFYLILFTLFYTVALVYSCIELFTIKKIYGDIEKKDFFHRANEIRINFIFVSLTNSFKIDKQELVRELDKLVDASEEPEKDKLKEYFHKSYLNNEYK